MQPPLPKTHIELVCVGKKIIANKRENFANKSGNFAL